MANEIKLDVKLNTKLDESLKQVINATKGLNLTKQQSESFGKYQKGAQLALKTNDLKSFQSNFNSLVDIFKSASTATGKLSDKTKELTELQSKLSKEVNAAVSKRSDLQGKLTKTGRLTKSAADKFAQSNTNAQKVFGTDGKQLSRDAIINAQTQLAKTLQDAGLT